MMCFLNIYLVFSLIVFLQITKEYIDSYSHLFVVLCFVIILISVNHYSDVIEGILFNIEQYQGYSSFIEWIKNDYNKSRTKRTIDSVIKYFLLSLQNTHGYKT